MILREERRLEEAEQVLTDWATLLAEAGRDRDAADALRVLNTLLKFRCGFLESEKQQQ